MPSEMARVAQREFRSWLAMSASGRETNSLATLYLEWLREGGIEAVAASYSLAVEILLSTLIQLEQLGLDPAAADDTSAWDYMTECGFQYEVFHSQRRGRA